VGKCFPKPANSKKEKQIHENSRLFASIGRVSALFSSSLTGSLLLKFVNILIGEQRGATGRDG